jgi:hypothetical protein
MNRTLDRQCLLTRPTGIAGDSDEAPLTAENAGERRSSLCFEDIIPARKAAQMSSRPYRTAILALAAVAATASSLALSRPWFPTNVARNFHVNLSRFEIASLIFCGNLDTLEN